MNDCLACNGCVTSAETVLIAEQSLPRLLEGLRASSTRLAVVTVSPQSLASIAGEFLTLSPLPANQYAIFLTTQFLENSAIWLRQRVASFSCQKHRPIGYHHCQLVGGVGRSPLPLPRSCAELERVGRRRNCTLLAEKVLLRSSWMEYEGDRSSRVLLAASPRCPHRPRLLFPKNPFSHGVQRGVRGFVDRCLPIF